MPLNPSPEPRSLFEAALDEFDKRAGTNLLQHPIIDSLANCESADTIIDVLQEQTQAFRRFRGDDGDGAVMKWLKRTVHVLHALSTSDILAGCIGLPFPPANAIFAGIGILFTAINDISASYDAVLDLLESFESFLRRLDIYTKVPSTTAMTEIIVKILIELLSTISLAIQQARQGRLRKLGKKLLGENDVEAVLQRLDRLTQEEARTTAAQTLDIVYGLVKNIKVVMDDGKASTEEIHRALVLMQQQASDITKSRRDQLQERFRRWLSPPDPSINHNTARKAHHRGSAEWFVHGNTFSEWKSRAGSLIWLHGKPGSGKSLLSYVLLSPFSEMIQVLSSSTIIENIEEARKAGLASVAFFYFDFKDESKQAARGALSSLLVQLAFQTDACSTILSDLYSVHGSGSKQPSEDALRECLRKMLVLPEQGPVFMVFDAIDECPNSAGTPSPREAVLDLVQWLVELRYSHVHICVTSRPEVDIEDVVKPLASHMVSLHEEEGQIEDIKGYIIFFINSDRCTRKWRKEDKELVISKLCQSADGMFRWVYCQLDMLRRCLPQRIRKALDELPDTLDETYERTLLEIGKEKCTYAYRLFQCVAAAIRPLRVEELAEFLTFDFEAGGSPIFRADWRSEDPRDTVLSTCSTLISIVNVDGWPVVQFSHFSVKEYLISSRIMEGRVLRYHIPLEPAHVILTQACLSLLLHLDDHITYEQIKGFPLLDYAALYWMPHARFESVSSHTEDAMKQLFDPRNHHFAVWVRTYDIDRYSISRSRRGTPLYYAARCGFHMIAEWLVTTCSQDVMALGGRFKNPVYVASRYGHLKVVEILLKHNAAAANMPGVNGWAPLHAASLFGHLGVSRALLEFGAEVDVKTPSESRTPLSIALGGGHMEVAALLLENCADLNVRDKFGQTPLYWALQRGHPGLVQLLLAHGVDSNFRDEGGRTFTAFSLKEGQSERPAVATGSRGKGTCAGQPGTDTAPGGVGR